MEDKKLIDGGVFLGRNPCNGNELDENTLINLMNKYFIRKALVGHYKCIFYDYKEGNQELIRFYHHYPDRIVPIAIISPNGFDITNNLDYFDELKNTGVQVIGIYLVPKYYPVQLESLLLREMVQCAINKGFVIQFGLEYISDLNKVIDYYGYLNGPILIRWMAGRGYNNLAEIINICKHYSNIYFDISSINCSGGIKYLVETIGADRFYFSSGIPETFELNSHLLLQTASLDPADLTKIYSTTLSQILSPKKPRQDFLVDTTKFSKFWGEILRISKIDIHWHINGWNILEPNLDVNSFDEEFKKFNYHKVVLSSTKALNYDLERGNKEVFDYITKENRGNILYGLIVVNPTRISDSLSQIEKYAKCDRFVGMKTIQDLYGYGLDHENYCKIFEKAGRYNLPVMAHVPGILEASAKFPDITFICAHSTWERVKHLIKQRNVYFELSTSHNNVAETQMELFIQKAGEERLLFGSDGQLINPAWTIGKLASCNLKRETLNKIFYNNAIQAFPKLRF